MLEKIKNFFKSDDEKSVIIILKEFFTNKKSLSVLMLTLVPLAYVFFYVFAYLDIDNTTQDLQVGIVLEDKGTSKHNLSDKLKEKFQENDVVKWKFYDTKKKGINDLEKYENIYLLVELPNDLTKHIDNIKEKFDVKQIKINIYQYNTKNGIIGSVSETINGKIDEQIRLNIIKVAQDQAYNKSKNIKTNIDKLYEGLDKLNDGMDLLNSSLEKSSLKAIDKINIFDRMYKKFISSQLYNGFPKYKNDLNQANNDLRSMLEGDDSFYISNSSTTSLIKSKLDSITSKDNDKELKSLKEELNNEALKIDQIKEQLNVASVNIKQVNTNYDILSTIEKVIYNATNLSFNNMFASKVKSSTKLNPELKDKLLDINNFFISKKKNLKTASEGIKTIANTFNESKYQLENTLENNTTQIKNELEKMFKSLMQYYNLFNPNRVNSEENRLNQELYNLQSLAKQSQQKSKQISNIISLVIGRFDYKNFHRNSKNEIKDIISPVDVTSTDINKKQMFGAIFMPMTVAIGIWFLLIFLFVATITKKDLFNNVWNNYLAKLVITSILGTLVSLIILMVCSNLGIKVYHKSMFVLTTFVYTLSLSSLFMIFYYYTNEFARYILTMLLIFNITSSGATYPVTNLAPGFAYIEPFTHFKYYINTVRETISNIYDQQIYTKNLMWLLSFTLINVIISYIITKIISNRRK